MRIGDGSSDVCSSDPGPQLVDFAGREILDRAGALEDEHGLEMVLIVHRQFLAGEHRRDVEREAHIVVLEQQAGADPAVRPDVAVGFADVAEIADKHGNYLLFWGGGAYSEIGRAAGRGREW